LRGKETALLILEEGKRIVAEGNRWACFFFDITDPKYPFIGYPLEGGMNLRTVMKLALSFGYALAHKEPYCFYYGGSGEKQIASFWQSLDDRGGFFLPFTRVGGEVFFGEIEEGKPPEEGDPVLEAFWAGVREGKADPKRSKELWEFLLERYLEPEVLE